MRYACLIYYDPRSLFGGSPEANAALDECSTYDVKLKESGHFVMGEALVLPEEAMTVQVRRGKMSTVDGPFIETKEMLGGIVVIEARDLDEAVRVAGGHPLATIGSVEVRPVVDLKRAGLATIEAVLRCRKRARSVRPPARHAIARRDRGPG